MDLPDWIKKQESLEKAAELLCEKPRTVRSWLYLARAPRLAQACRIVLNTGGAVDFNGIYSPYARQLAPRVAP